MKFFSTILFDRQGYRFAAQRNRGEHLASDVAELGLRKGDVGAIYMKSSAELVIVFYAVQRLGVVVAWMNPIYRELEARFIVENSGARAVESLRPPSPTLESVVFVPRPGGSASLRGSLTLEDLGRRGARRRQAEPAALEPDDLSMLFHTSGTTGKPKRR